MRSMLYLADGILGWLARPGDAPDWRPLALEDEVRLAKGPNAIDGLKGLSPNDSLSTAGEEIYDRFNGGSQLAGPGTRGGPAIVPVGLAMLHCCSLICPESFDF
jgi:hypothetical protein